MFHRLILTATVLLLVLLAGSCTKETNEENTATVTATVPSDTTMTSTAGTDTTATSGTTTVESTTTTTASGSVSTSASEKIEEGAKQIASGARTTANGIAAATGTALERAGEKIQEKVAQAEQTSAPAKTASGNAAQGATLFQGRCVSCHAADGSGNTAIGKKQGIRDFHSADFQKQTDAEIANIIANGKGPMSAQAHKSKNLTQAQIQDLVAYLRTLAR